MSKKHNFDDVKLFFKSKGFTVISENYKNSRLNLDVVCSNGHNINISYNNLKQGKRCAKCSKRAKPDINYVLECFINRGYEPLFDEYKNNHTKLQYRCCLHSDIIQEIDWNRFSTGQGCKYCGYENMAIIKRKNYDEIVKEFLKKDLILLPDNIYKNNNSDLQFYCKNHPTYTQTIDYNHFNRGQGCNECNKINYSGENSHSWKGGITPEVMLIRCSAEYREWRNQVFERDNYTCQCCGDNTGHNLQAHHIENFADNVELRFDINNGITFCNRCHDFRYEGSFHNIYGTRNNTREQLEEYIKQKSQQEAV